VSFSGPVRSRVYRSSTRIVVILIIVSLGISLSPVQAEVAGTYARHALRSAFAPSPNTSLPPAKAQDFVATQQDPSRNADRVTHFRLCPRHLVIYQGEVFTLSPVPLDQNREVVQGVAVHWATSDPNVARVVTGEVTANAPGQAIVTAEAGVARANVAVEVRAGHRPRLSDLAWDVEHANDCDSPEASQVTGSQSEIADESDHRAAAGDAEITPRVSAVTRRSLRLGGENLSHNNPVESEPESRALNQLARPAALRTSRSADQRTVGRVLPAHAATAAAHGKIFGRGFFQAGGVIDGSSGDPTVSVTAATGFNNATGTARFGPQEASQAGAAKTKNNLGSYDYVLSAPVLSLGGRGIGVNLALTNNSRVWTKDSATSTMVFNYNKGWPAAGWTLGYGRLLKNYDNSASGDQSGVGSANAPGNYLLIQPDGSHVHLQQSYDSVNGVWWNDSNDGTFVHLNPRNNRMTYPDGLQVNFNWTNNRLLPVSLKTTNGDLITIAYRTFDKVTTSPTYFPVRWAIDSVTDTLGRVIVFHYYGDAGYPVGSNPQFALATITAPDQAGGTRTLVQLDYQTMTLQYSFSISVDPGAPASGSQISVLRRIYYPATGAASSFRISAPTAWLARFQCATT
jgi:hypothetical protein